MGFLKKIGKAIKKVGKKFLSGVTGGLSDAVLGGVSNAAQNAVQGPQRVSLADNQHAQNLLDLNNPRDIARQSEFLTGIAPAQASAYNNYQDATHAQDTQRQIDRQRALAPVEAETDLAYMDTVYAGTSPWERLGSSAAPSLSAPSPSDDPAGGSSPDSGAFLPLLTTQMQTENAKEIARIQAQSAQTIAAMNNETHLQAVGVQTADGRLPNQQIIESASRTLLQEAQKWQAEASAGKTQVETLQVQQKMQIDAITAFLSASPKEIIDLGLIKYEHRPGWEGIIKMLTHAGNEETRREDIAAALAALPPDQWKGVKRDVLEIAGMIQAGAKSASGLLSSAGKFLPTLGKNAGTSGKKTFKGHSGTWALQP